MVNLNIHRFSWYFHCVFEKILFIRFLQSLVLKVIKNFGGRSVFENYHPNSLILAVSNFMSIKSWNAAFFSDFQHDFNSSRFTTDLLTIVLDKSLGLLTDLWLIELCHLTYTRYSTEVSMLFFFTNSKYKLSSHVFSLTCYIAIHTDDTALCSSCDWTWFSDYSLSGLLNFNLSYKTL